MQQCAFSADGKNCTDDDYKEWSPSDNGYENCLLGQKTVFQRRRTNSLCFNGRQFDRKISVRNCSCHISDYECDFGYKRQFVWSRTCMRDPDAPDVDVHAVPSPCPAGTYYRRSKGYRRVEGDTCSGGDEYRFEPDQILCPSQSLTDYLIYVSGDALSTVSLASAGGGDHRELRIPISRSNDADIGAVAYDYGHSCVYWVNTRINAIQRLCFSGRGALYVNDTVVQEDPHGTHIISDIAFDWMSNTIYWSTTAAEIHIAKIDSYGPLGFPHRKRLLYPGMNGTNFPNSPAPRGRDFGMTLAVYPRRGLMFWADRRDNSIYRAHMDGYNVTKIVVGSCAYRFHSYRVFVSSSRLFLCCVLVSMIHALCALQPCIDIGPGRLSRVTSRSTVTNSASTSWTRRTASSGPPTSVEATGATTPWGAAPAT